MNVLTPYDTVCKSFSNKLGYTELTYLIYSFSAASSTAMTLSNASINSGIGFDALLKL